MKKQGNIALVMWVVIMVMTGYTLNALGAEDKEHLSLLLARTCVAEVGFVGTIQECQLMWSVNNANAVRKNRTLEQQTRSFNRYWRSQKQRDKRPWIQYLTNHKKPQQWCDAAWSNYRNQWLLILQKAREFLNGDRKMYYDCPGVSDYGAPSDRPANASKMTKVRCLDGKSLQRYWRSK